MPDEMKYYVSIVNASAIIPFVSRSASKTSDFLCEILQKEPVLDANIGYPTSWHTSKVKKINELVKHTEFNKKVIMAMLVMLI